MQNPSEDTQWNDALRRHGILPEKEVSEDQLIDLVEETVQKKTGNIVKAYEDMTLEELEELEDEEDERVLLQYSKEWQKYRNFRRHPNLVMFERFLPRTMWRKSIKLAKEFGLFFISTKLVFLYVP